MALKAFHVYQGENRCVLVIHAGNGQSFGYGHNNGSFKMGVSGLV